MKWQGPLTTHIQVKEPEFEPPPNNLAIFANWTRTFGLKLLVLLQVEWSFPDIIWF